MHAQNGKFYRVHGVPKEEESFGYSKLLNEKECGEVISHTLVGTLE